MEQEEPEQKAEEPNKGRFTRKVYFALQLAQEETIRLQLHFIDTEHLLLGLVKEMQGVVPQTPYVGPLSDGDDLAVNIFRNLNIDPQKVQTEVERLVNRRKRAVPTDIGLTPHTKKAIEMSVYEARRLNQQHIGTGHLLLGLLREEKGIAAMALKRLRINLKKARAQTAQLLAQTSPPNK